MNIQKPSLQFRNSLSVRKSTRCIVLHHADAEKFSVYQCHACHLNNGWAGIGYHYYITKDGTIWEGRPDNTVGAHASGGNSDSIGICFDRFPLILYARSEMYVMKRRSVCPTLS